MSRIELDVLDRTGCLKYNGMNRMVWDEKDEMVCIGWNGVYRMDEWIYNRRISKFVLKVMNLNVWNVKT